MKDIRLSEDMEKCVLGTLLAEKVKFHEVKAMILPSCLQHPKHQLILKSIVQAAEVYGSQSPQTVFGVMQELVPDSSFNDLEFLKELVAKYSASTADLGMFKMLSDQALLRDLSDVLVETHSSIQTTPATNLTTVVDGLYGNLNRIKDQMWSNDTNMDMTKLLDSVVQSIKRNQELDSKVVGISTGFPSLDQHTLGLHRGDLIVVAGRPSMGKTAFAMNIAQHVCLTERLPVYTLSMEMPAPQIVLRMISCMTSIDLLSLRTGRLSKSAWAAVNKAVDELKAAPLIIDDCAAHNVMSIEKRLREAYNLHGGLGLVVIDYMQLITSPSYSGNRVSEMSDISRALKHMAKEFKAPIIAISQLNRSLELRVDKKPVLADLRESGAIEQDADLILFLYKTGSADETEGKHNIVKVTIGKHRNGPTADIKLQFVGKHTQFVDNFKSA